ncbi:MAG: alpha-2-macroglobulin, partial [Acidobacteriota bacterium]
GKAITALSAHFLGDDAKARMLVRALAGDAVVDSRPDKSILVRDAPPARKSLVETAHWGASGFWWNWYDSPVESTAFALKALLAVDPKNPLVEPAVNWLIRNRRGAQWSNTRNTAVAILALDDYLAASGELQADVTYDVAVNGHPIARRHVSGKDVIAAPSVFEVKPEDLKSGRNTVTITRVSGGAPLYFSAQASFFSTEEPVTPAGNELFVHRRYYRLIPHDTLLNGVQYNRKRLRDGDTIRSGEVVECVLTVEAKNDYRYLVFEDLKPAGFEALNDKSGGWFRAFQLTPDAAGRLFGESGKGRGKAPALQNTDYPGRREYIYPEYRDRKAAFFVSRLPQGFWQITYKLRAETPGYFHALPALGYAMYVPEIRGNGKEERFTVKDAKGGEKGD